MAYSDFSYPEVLQRLDLVQVSVENLFADVVPVEASPSLKADIDVDARLGIAAHTEFSRAVWVVGPILKDVWRRYKGQVTLIAGAELKADPEAGLTGFLDFVIGRAPHQHIINAPVMVIVEAKRDSITDGFGQAIAGMVGAQRFNAKHGKPVDAIYGCSTTGTAWRFLKLAGSTVSIDLTEYQHDHYEKLLGILTNVVGPVTK